MADIPEGVTVTVADPHGHVIEEFDMDGYDPYSSTEAGSFGWTLFQSIGRWMDREPEE